MDFSSDNARDYTPFAKRLADLARAETLPRFRAGGPVINKAGAGYDPVTDADREAERAQRAAINAEHPEHGIMGEEFGAERQDAPWRWVLDPVDGTRAFVCGAISWTSLIALEHLKRPVIGVIDQPFSDERWVGAAGVSTYYHKGEAALCRTSGVQHLDEARLSTTDPRMGEIFNQSQATAYEAVQAKVRLVRYSLDAYAYGLLASGHFDLVIEAGLQRHDFAALQPVVEGAGGVFTDWDGSRVSEDKGGRVLAAASPALHQEAMAILAAHL